MDRPKWCYSLWRKLDRMVLPVKTHPYYQSHCVWKT